MDVTTVIVAGILIFLAVIFVKNNKAVLGCIPVLVWLAFMGLIIYVIAHFVIKYW